MKVREKSDWPKTEDWVCQSKATENNSEDVALHTHSPTTYILASARVDHSDL